MNRYKTLMSPMDPIMVGVDPFGPLSPSLFIETLLGAHIKAGDSTATGESTARDVHFQSDPRA